MGQDTVIQSSAVTREWLDRICRAIGDQLEYRESRYWAVFASPKGCVIAYLNPSKTGIRLFLRLPVSHAEKLVSTPSSHSWAENFPSVFKIRSEGEIVTAVELIKASALL
jgi:hypothetical protein